MKKYISMLMVALMAAFTFASCDTETDEKAGGTAVEKMAGQWVVTDEQVDENGNIIERDLDENGKIVKFDLYTYNTSANDANKMWLEEGSFWGVKMKVNITDYNNGKFTADANAAYNIEGSANNQVEYLNGQVLYGQGKNLHGMPTDSISITVKFNDADGKIYRYSGIRYSGFQE